MAEVLGTLSPRGRSILSLVAVPTSLGYSHSEVALVLCALWRSEGHEEEPPFTEAWVSGRMRELRKEIERLMGEARMDEEFEGRDMVDTDADEVIAVLVDTEVQAQTEDGEDG